MEKEDVGYLENLYMGSLADGAGFPPAPDVDERAVDAFMERFKEAVSGFEARKIEEMHAVPPRLLQRLREIGMFGLIVGRVYGGSGFGLHEYLSVIERMSESDMALALIPLAHLSIGVMGLLLFGTEQQKSRYLPKAAGGETIFAYALTEPDTGSDAQHVRTSAMPAEDGRFFVLNGTKTYITNANYAGAFSVFAQMDPGNPGRMGMFVVERAWEGVSVGADMPKMGLSVSSTASVRFSEVRVPKENLVGEPGDGFKIAMTILNYGRLGLGAASAGLLSASLRDMERRSRTRAQFGVPIRRFELIQEKLVRARVHGLAASAMTSFTASLLERSPRMNVALESSHCKLYGTTRCWDALYDAQQTAGGSGYLSTLPYEKRLRDFRVTTIFEGTTEIHSIYPPLALLRFFGKKMQETGAPGRLLLLRRIAGKIGLRRAEGRETNPTLRRALRAAAQCERLFRSLLAKGLLRYGGRVVWEEFFLRRMTNLSMALFALVAAVWRVKSGHPEGGYPEEELDALRYLAEEAREVCGRDGRPGPTPKESIIRRMMKET